VSLGRSGGSSTVSLGHDVTDKDEMIILVIDDM
jgi:hypothetical protein